jgi:Zn-finger nucleic acid-binding protein
MVYREQSRPCPACGGELAVQSLRWRFERCAACGGAFVEEGVLAEMMREMGAAAPPIFGPRAHGPARRCPGCAEPMAWVALEILPLERCPAHGIWFDPEELQQALHAGAPVAPATNDRLTPLDVILGILDILSFVP